MYQDLEKHRYQRGYLVWGFFFFFACRLQDKVGRAVRRRALGHLRFQTKEVSFCPVRSRTVLRDVKKAGDMIRAASERRSDISEYLLAGKVRSWEGTFCEGR